MNAAIHMYHYLRKYLSPIQSHDLVKARYSNVPSMQELEMLRLKKYFAKKAFGSI